MGKEENIYWQCREEADMTRDEASEALKWISADRIDRIEHGAMPRADEILAMAEGYQRPDLCNYYCSHECEIGQKFVPEVRQKDLANIILELVSTLNKLDREKDRLIDITADGEISSDEHNDFMAIQNLLEKVSLSVDSLNLWLQKKVTLEKM